MYKIPKQLMCVLENHRRQYKKEWEQNYPWYKRMLAEKYKKASRADSWHRSPKIFMLIGCNNTITNLIPLAKESGCGLMPGINQSEFGRALGLIPEGHQFMGLARVGAFHTHNTGNMGYVKNDLRSLSRDTVFLSVGRNGFLFERPITKSEIHRLKLKVV